MNVEEATAIVEEATEVPVEGECHAKSETPILVSLPPVFYLDDL